MKIGDIVTISHNLGDLETAHKAYPFGLNTTMLNLCGKQAQIVSIKNDSYPPSKYPGYPDCDGKLYHIDLDNGAWSWANIMFEEGTFGLKIVEEEL